MVFREDSEKENLLEESQTQTESHSNGCLYSFYFILILLLTVRLSDCFYYERFKTNSYLSLLHQKYYENSNTGDAIYKMKRQFCGLTTGCQVVVPFKKMYPEYLISPKHKLSTCLIPKNMSTLLTAIFCLLNNSQRLQTEDKKLYERLERECSKPYSYKSLKNVHKYFDNDAELQNFVFIRDPIERFLSGFMMLCAKNAGLRKSKEQCFGCGDDIRCVAKRLLKYADGWSKGDRSEWENNYLWHLAPQNWHCDFERNLQQFKFVYYSPLEEERIVRELTGILENGNVNGSTIDTLTNEMSSGSTKHQTSRLDNRNRYLEEVMNSTEIKKTLVQIFYYDYVIFGYPFPDLK